MTKLTTRAILIMLAAKKKYKYLIFLFITMEPNMKILFYFTQFFCKLLIFLYSYMKKKQKFSLV